MLKLHQVRRALAVTAVALALTSAAPLAAGAAETTHHAKPVTFNPDATAAARTDTVTASSPHMRPNDGYPCSGSWRDIGSPGNIYYYGTYAGQVEQLWDSSCNMIQAHWQWDGNFQASHAGARVCVSLEAPDAHGGTVPTCADTGQKNVSSYSWVHSANPDWWRAEAGVSYGGSGACLYDTWGTYHSYGGWDVYGPHTGGCNFNGNPY